MRLPLLALLLCSSSALAAEGDPVWTIRAGAIGLHRASPDGQTLIVNQTFQPLLDASEFDFGLEAGWELDVTREINRGLALQARYFSIDEWSDDLSVTNPLGTGLLFANNQSAGVFTVESTSSLEYNSSMESVELNAICLSRGRVRWLGGVRYLNLDERLRVISRDLTGMDAQAVNRVDTENDLYGCQVGAEAWLWRRGRLRLDGVGKVGVYGNDAENRLLQQTANLNVPDINVASGLGETRAAFLGELALIASCQLTGSITLRGGYQVLWLEGVALASGQPIVNPDPAVTPATTIDFDRLFLQGVNLGLEFRY